MNISFYISLAVFVAVVLAEESITDPNLPSMQYPYGQAIDSRDHLPVGVYNSYNYKQSYPYNYNDNHQQQPYQQVNPYGYQNGYNGYQNQMNSFVARQNPPSSQHPNFKAQATNPLEFPPIYYPPGWYFPHIKQEPITVGPKM